MQDPCTDSTARISCHHHSCKSHTHKHPARAPLSERRYRRWSCWMAVTLQRCAGVCEDHAAMCSHQAYGMLDGLLDLCCLHRKHKAAPATPFCVAPHAAAGHAVAGVREPAAGRVHRAGKCMRSPCAHDTAAQAAGASTRNALCCLQAEAQGIVTQAAKVWALVPGIVCTTCCLGLLRNRCDEPAHPC